MRIENQGLPIQLKTAHVKHLLQVFHSDKDHNDPYLAKNLGDEETARQYVYPEIIWRVIENLYPKLKPLFPTLLEEHLKSQIYVIFASDKVKEKIEERYGTDFLTYVDISEDEAQEIANETIASCNLSELKETIGGNLHDSNVMSQLLQERRGLV